MSSFSTTEFADYITTISSVFFDNGTEISENVTSLAIKTADVLKEPELRTFMRYALVGWGTLIVGVFGLFGNVLSAVILIKPSMRSSLNFLLFFLTIWDSFLILTTILYLSIPTIFRYIQVSKTLTDIWFPHTDPYLYALRCTAQLGSALFTLLVTAERYIAVCWPLHSRTLCTKRKALLFAGFTSAFAILYNLPRYWDFETVSVTKEGENGTLSTVYKMESTSFRCNKIYYNYYLTWGAFVINSAIPFFFLFVFNYFICRAIAKFNKTRKILANGSPQSKEISLTKMFVCVITVSLLASGLNLFLVVIDSFWKLDLSWQLWYVEKVLITFNSSVNCIFYCAFGTRFRKEFMKMFISGNTICCSCGSSKDLKGGKRMDKSLEISSTQCSNLSTNSMNSDITVINSKV